MQAGTHLDGRPAVGVGVEPGAIPRLADEALDGSVQDSALLLLHGGRRRRSRRGVRPVLPLLPPRSHGAASPPRARVREPAGAAYRRRGRPPGEGEGVGATPEGVRRIGGSAAPSGCRESQLQQGARSDDQGSQVGAALYYLHWIIILR